MTDGEKKQLHRAVFAAVYVREWAEAMERCRATFVLGSIFDAALANVSECGGAERAYTIANQAVVDYEAWSPGGSAAG